MVPAGQLSENSSKSVAKQALGTQLQQHMATTGCIKGVLCEPPSSEFLKK